MRIRNAMAVAQYVGQYPLELSSFCGPRQQQCWHQAELANPKDFHILSPHGWCWNLQSPNIRSSFVLIRPIRSQVRVAKGSRTIHYEPLDIIKIVSSCQILISSLSCINAQVVLLRTKDWNNRMNDTIISEINVPDAPIDKTIFAGAWRRQECQWMEILCEVFKNRPPEVSIFVDVTND